MKCWAITINDKPMEIRANIMLSILEQSINSYILMNNNNSIQPSNFIKNKVTGITFENKCDYTTYFGKNLEYIHGIHMIPITPISSFIRHPGFVKEEWDEIISNIIKNVDDGWKGILMLNLALLDPRESWNFFANDGFQMKWLDGGMSRTWSLAYIAGVGGA